MTDTPKLSARQRAAIKILIENPRVRQFELAEAVGVSDRTIRTWQLQPHFAAALDAAVAASAASARGLARRLHGDVVRELSALAFDDASPAIRLRACCALLDHLHNQDLDEVLERIDALEARHQEQQ
jgi:DNA-binding transcriptional MerR regulator